MGYMMRWILPGNTTASHDRRMNNWMFIRRVSQDRKGSRRPEWVHAGKSRFISPAFRAPFLLIIGGTSFLEATEETRLQHRPTNDRVAGSIKSTWGLPTTRTGSVTTDLT